MKKILLIASLSLFALTSFAQSATVTMTGTGDTIVDTGTDFVVKQVEGVYQSVSVQAVFTKVGGTVAGTAILYASVDGTNYIRVNTDTLTMTNVTTNTKIWIVDDSSFMYYKVVFLGVGTMSGIVKGYLFGTSPQGKHGTVTMLSNYSHVSDTITNSGSGYLEKRVSGAYTNLSIQSVVTKLSGTAGGTVTVQGSNDGTNYVTVNIRYISAQTQSIANVTTNTKIFVITGSPYSYYRLSYTGTGTMACTIKGYLLANK